MNNDNRVRLQVSQLQSMRYDKINGEHGLADYYEFDVVIATDAIITRHKDNYSGSEVREKLLLTDSSYKFRDGDIPLQNGHGYGTGGGDGETIGLVLKNTAKVIRSVDNPDVNVLMVKVRIVDDNGLGSIYIKRWMRGVATNISIGYEIIKRDTKTNDENGIRITMERVDEFIINETSIVNQPADTKAGANKRSKGMTDLNNENLNSDGGQTDDKVRETAFKNKDVRADIKSNDIERLDDSNRSKVNSEDDLNRSKGRTDNMEDLRVRALKVSEELKIVSDKIINIGATSEGDSWAENVRNEVSEIRSEMPFMGESQLRSVVSNFTGKYLSKLAESPSSKIKAVNLSGEKAELRARDVFDRFGANDALGDNLEYFNPTEAFNSPTSTSADRMRAHNDNYVEILGDQRFPNEMVGYMRSVLSKPQNYVLPVDYFIRAQSQGEDSGTKGGVLVDNILRLDKIRDQLYPMAVLAQAGAMMEMATGNLVIPKASTSAVAYNLGEIDAVTFSDITFTSETTSPHRVGVALTGSRQLDITSGGFIRPYAMRQMMEVLSTKLCLDHLVGNGSGDQITGLFNTSNINIIEFGTNGGKWTLEKFREARLNARNKNYNGVISGIMSPDALDALYTTVRETGDARMILEEGQTGGYGTLLSTTQVPQNGTKGTHTATDLQSAIFASMKDILLISYGLPFVVQDEVTKANTAQWSTHINVFHDLFVGRPEFVSKITDITIR